MVLINDKTLRIQGKVDVTDVAVFLNKPEGESREKATGWFFIDYSPADFPLQTVFNLSFSANGKALSSSTIILDAVCDSFGHFLKDGIPKGYKTAARFRFPGGLPEAFAALPLLKGWQPADNEILLTNTENIQLNNLPELLNDLAQFMVSDLQQNRYPHATKIGKQEFLNELKKSRLKNAEDLLAFLSVGGFIRQDENEIELRSGK